jgi:hypothetical protein
MPGQGHIDVPGDEYFLNPPPDCGIDPGKVNHEADFNLLLSVKLLGKQSPSLDESDLKQIQFELNEVCEWEKCHYYFLYRTMGDGRDPPPFIERLGRRFPQIVFLGLAARPTDRDHEIISRVNRLRLRKVRY